MEQETKLALKKIELIGFKSFADKTVLQFHPGITAIVGPNGCGKSNISDAFRWVLGEQSAKSMRGNKMHDVIFAGTTKRKPVNFAEVIITLDGNVGNLPTQYQEIAVGRRIHRSGESEYLLNRTSVRLKDVQDLFLDSGIGKNAFSIFEQGKLDQVINLPPLERRFIFEEAAGISRFLQRKREALRRLEQTELNISRVMDIHQEVKRQILVLEEQAKKATLYKENKSKMDRLDIAFIVAKWDDLQTKLAGISQSNLAKKQQLDALNQSIAELDRTRQTSNLQFIEAQKQLQTQRESVFKVRSDQEIKSQEIKYAEERLKELQIKEQQWTRELAEMESKRKMLQTETAHMLMQQQEMDKRVTDAENLKKAQRDKLSACDNETALLRNQQKEAQKELLLLFNQEKAAENEARQALFRLEHTQEKKSRFQEQKELLSNRLIELSNEIERKTKRIDELSKEVSSQKDGLHVLEKQIQQCSDTIKDIQKQCDSLHHERAECRARLHVLLKLREEMQGFSLGAKKILQASSSPSSPLYNRVKGLYQSLSPETGSEKAIAAILKSYAHTLVVQSLADLDVVLTFINQNNLKDLSLICCETMQKNMSIVPPQASVLSKISDNDLARHFLENVYLTSNLQEALQIDQGAAAWTQNSIYIDPKRVLFFPSDGESNVFLREAEIHVLQEKLEQMTTQSQTLEDEQKLSVQKRSQLLSQKAAMDLTVRQQEMKLAEKKFSNQRMQSDREKIKKEIDAQEKEALILDNLSRQLQASISDSNHKHAVAKAKVEDISKKLESSNAFLEEMTAKLKCEQQVLYEKEQIYHKVMEEKRKLAHQHNLLEVKELECIQQQKRIEEELNSLSEHKRRLHQKSLECHQSLEQIKLQLEEGHRIASEREVFAQQRKEAIAKIEESIANQREYLKRAEGEWNQACVECVKMESAIQSIQNELKERHQLEIEEARAKGYSIEQTFEKTERAIRALRREIEAAGDINMTAIDEFEQHKTRHDFLSKQLEDLSVSKEELVQIITHLDTESRKMFKETFEIIRGNFKKNFQILFSGGEANIAFTEEGDILEAGIEIDAKPPGKQMRSINLLSGGEKCLTALALLFAIFEVKPAPFCILDEIDAPLDDTNVERFLNVVKQFTNRCQFIIITHNKRTMSIADILFGVTMQEKGVSNILSIEFAKVTRPSRP